MPGLLLISFFCFSTSSTDPIQQDCEPLPDNTRETKPCVVDAKPDETQACEVNSDKDNPVEPQISESQTNEFKDDKLTPSVTEQETSSVSTFKSNFLKFVGHVCADERCLQPVFTKETTIATDGKDDNDASSSVAQKAEGEREIRKRDRIYSFFQRTEKRLTRSTVRTLSPCV